MLKAINLDIQNIGDKNIFKDVVPNLSGQSFEAKIKETTELINLPLATKPQPLQEEVFH